MLPAGLFTGLPARPAAVFGLPAVVLSLALAPAVLLGGFAALVGDAVVLLGAVPEALDCRVLPTLEAVDGAALAVGLPADFEGTSLDTRRTVTVAVPPAVALGFEPVRELRAGFAVRPAPSLAPSSFFGSDACKRHACQAKATRVASQ